MNKELVHFRFFKKETTGWINCIFRDKVLLFRRLLQLKSDLCNRQVYGWLTRWPEALTSFLAAALGRVCVLFLCSSRAACARTRVCECFRSHSANHTRSGEMRSGSWFLEEWTAAKPQTNATARQLNIQAGLIISSPLTSSLSGCEGPLGAELQTCSLALFYLSTPVM